MDDTTDTVSRKISLITERIDPEAAANIQTFGGVTLATMVDAMEVAKYMAIGEEMVPAHLRGKQGKCLGLVMRALNWGFDPFALAAETMVVNDKVGYTSAVLHAAAEMRAPIIGGFHHDFSGDGEDLQCTVSAIRRDTRERIQWTSPRIGDIKVKNSQEWRNNPPKQLYYHTRRDFVRVFFPQVLLGAYTIDELQAMKNEGPPIVDAPNLLERLPGREGGAKPEPELLRREIEEMEEGGEPPAAAQEPEKPPEKKKGGWVKGRPRGAKVPTKVAQKVQEATHKMAQEAAQKAQEAAESPEAIPGPFMPDNEPAEPPASLEGLMFEEPRVPADTPIYRGPPRNAMEYHKHFYRMLEGLGTDSLQRWFDSERERGFRGKFGITGTREQMYATLIREKANKA